jgi:hypothetical protein
MTDHWNQLKELYAKDGLALFLGAGVSIGSGIPTWENLICRMMDSLPATGGKAAFDCFRAAGFSLPTITEFIERTVQDEESFVETLRKCLYRDFPCRNVKQAYDKESAQKIVDHIKSDNPTLDAVYNLAVRDSNNGLQANPKIQGIVNFNLDALLESYDAARNKVRGVDGRERCLRTIESSSHDPLLSKINSYHPHGYLRFDHRARKAGKEAAIRVLAEHEFFEFYNRTTEIFTYTMLYFLRAYHCLFIGMSMTDDNVRRLLFYSKSERERSRMREGLNPKEPRHFVILSKIDENSKLFEFTETMLAALGVLPLWINGFGDIPQKFAALPP